jgi:drug/metabolite transporter (DMT)-like permease
VTVQSHRKGLALAFTGGMLLTFDAPLLKAAGADLATMIFVRGLMFTAGMAAMWWLWGWARGERTPFFNGREGLIMGVIFWIGNMLFMSAITYAPVANVVFILACNPMLAALLAYVFLGERISLPTAAAILVAAAGVLIIVWDGLSAGGWFGDVLALGCAVSVAISLAYARSVKKDLATSGAMGAFLAALTAAPFAQPLALSTEGYAWLALNGLALMPLSTAMLILAPRHLSAPEVALFFLLESCLTPVWMWFAFAQAPSLAVLIGGAVVIAAIFALSTWRLLAARDA